MLGTNVRSQGLFKKWSFNASSQGPEVGSNGEVSGFGHKGWFHWLVQRLGHKVGSQSWVPRIDPKGGSQGWVL